MEFVEKTFKIEDKPITIRVSDENVADQYFDFSELQSEWHRKKVGQYHFSSLLRCLRRYYYEFQFDTELSLADKGVFLAGRVWHKHIQDYLEKTYGFVIIERPICDEFSVFLNRDQRDDIEIIGKIDIIDTKKSLEADIKTTSYLPMLIDMSEDKFEEKYGRYILQLMAYGYFLNHTYFEGINPIETLRIILVDKKTLETKLIEMDYNQESLVEQRGEIMEDGWDEDESIAEYFYLKIRNRAKTLHKCLVNEEVPEQHYCSKNCQYCPFAEEHLCEEGFIKVKSLKPPEIPETIKYKKKFGANKRPYWKWLEDEQRWKKSNGFIEFLKNDLGYSKEEIGDLP
jgi:hypothetical protein